MFSLIAPYLDIAVITVVVFVAAASGGIFAPGQWYETLNKPSWTPPDWAFPLVWTVLYIMIAAAGVIIWREQGFGPAMIAWTAQLVLNGAWSWLMFGLKQIGLALADAGGMVIAIVAFMALAWPVSQTAALLFVPYLAWTLTAFFLNLRILQLNPSIA
ncbi:MAG: TspO/MBR family protein [Pseudomonadota bacterium]